MSKNQPRLRWPGGRFVFRNLFRHTNTQNGRCLLLSFPSLFSPSLFSPSPLALRPSPFSSLVGVAGFEPATLRLSSACSNQLSYTPEEAG